MKYNHKDIEKKWQKKWEESKVFEVREDEKKKKLYILDMFPYPSAEGLHVGHPEGYTASDIIARKKIMEGYNVLHPMGWDAFGLPAENYAIKHKIHPSKSTAKNIEKMKKQIKSLGFAYDWSREINTSDPEYYKWTQWIFLEMWKRGLAYEATVPINWCPLCKTGLANEEVIDGKCERCGAEVGKKDMRQWLLRITEYAERLLEGLDKLDWPGKIKEMQKNWIGKSEGVVINFSGAKCDIECPQKAVCGMTCEEYDIPVFTTRIDTIFGATFVVLAPEHPLVPVLVSPDHREKVEKYLEEVKKKSEVERLSIEKEKTGVPLGASVVNPFTGERIPVWVADYVLLHYGTGAVMCVPAHDQRDFEFAKKYGLALKWVIAPPHELAHKEIAEKNKAYEEDGYLVNSGEFNGLTSRDARVKLTDYLESKNRGRRQINYHLRDWVFSRQRYWGEPMPLVFCENCKNEKQKILLIHGFEGSGEGNWFPWLKKELKNNGFEVFNPTMSTSEHPTVESWMKELMPFIKQMGEDDVIVGHSLGSKAALHLIEKTNKRIGHLYLIASAIGEVEERDWRRFREEWGGSDIDSLKKFWEEKFDWEKIGRLVADKNIILSDDDPYIKIKTHENIPSGWFFQKWHGFGHFQEKETPELLSLILRSKNTGWVSVPEYELPLKLPDVKHYEPTGTGESPLAAISKWVNVKCPKCGGPARRETNTMPQWAGSCWYYIAYLIRENSKFQIPNSKINYWIPVDLYVGGAEHAVLHLLYARFWYKFLYDLKLAPNDEPFLKLKNQGIILGEDGVKMSKSRGNVINPDDVIEKYGADTMRLYEMFMGEFSEAKPWNTRSIIGIRRFLERIWAMFDRVQKESIIKFPIFNSQFSNKFQISNSKIRQPTTNNQQLEKLMHKTIKGVSEDIESFKFNTAISKLMIYSNALAELRETSITNLPRSEPQVLLRGYQLLITLLSPFAPHLCEEIWEKLDHTDFIIKEKWPEYNPELTKDEEIDLIIQVNGKLRDTLRVPADIGGEEAKKVALESEKVEKWLEGKEIKKIIFVQNKLINIVIS